MSKSVKLSNGDYIDASAVWDNAQGKTIEKAAENYCRIYKCGGTASRAKVTVKHDAGNRIFLVFGRENNSSSCTVALVNAATLSTTLMYGTNSTLTFTRVDKNTFTIESSATYQLITIIGWAATITWEQLTD